MYEYKAHVTNIVDGDTFDAMVDLGFGVIIRHRFRLIGIDTPETWRPKSKAEKAHGMEAAKYARELMLGQEIVLTSQKLGIYGRYAAHAYVDLGGVPISVADLLREKGFVKRDDYEED